MRPDHGDIGSPLPPRPRPFSRALRCLSVRRPPHLSARFHPPVSLARPPEFYGLCPARCSPEKTLRPLQKPTSASHRASSLIATSTSGVHSSPAFHCELRSLRDVSRVLEGLLRHQLRGLVSSRCHVQGSPYRDLSLTAEPYRVSPAHSCPRAVGRRAPAV